MPFPIDLSQPSFKDFIFKDKTNRRYLIIAAAAIVGQLILFKLFYPFASFFYTDSFGYLYAAISNQDANVWPVGYSKFLRVFNTFIHSDTGLVIFQYVFLQAAGLYWWFTVNYLFRPSKTLAVILYSCIVFSPLSLYLANSVSSDALFIGLSLGWMALLLRMMRYPSKRAILVHALLLAAIFTIRYNAIWYPLAAALAIGLSRYSIKEKAIAIALPLVLIGAFMLHTGRATEEMTGTREFSPFSGWQMANNALYIYGHVLPQATGAQPPGAQSANPAPANPPPARFAVLDSAVRKYYTTETERKTLFDSAYPGIFYLWSRSSPLITYLGEEKKRDSGVAYFKVWTSVSPLYADYGAWLIKKYPVAFAQYYCWPNMVRYALPPLEFVDRYNSDMDTVEAVARHWFHYKDIRVHAASRSFQHSFLAFYPLLNLLINLFFLGTLGLFFSTPGAGRADPLFTRSIKVIAGCWGLHFIFSVFAAPVVLRYQLVAMTVDLSFAGLIVDYLLKWEIKQTSDEKEKYSGRRRSLLPDSFMGLHRDG